MLGATLLISQPVKAQTCLNGYELTAIVVLENDIRQAVSAYACQKIASLQSPTYDTYQKLREQWKDKRAKQTRLRDKTYQRIYGKDWQTKVDDWTARTAASQSSLFKVSAENCSRLQTALDEHLKSWEQIYNAAARQAASKPYDPLRCEKVP